VGIAVPHGLWLLYVNLRRAHCDKAALKLRHYRGAGLH
jgi:hypothetical protein